LIYFGDDLPRTRIWWFLVDASKEPHNKRKATLNRVRRHEAQIAEKKQVADS
jgi:hypothetical protein